MSRGRRAQRIYTFEEKVRLVTEISRPYRAGGGSLRAIAESLGATDQNYYNWLKAGIRPTPPATPSKVYSADQREQLVAKIDQLCAAGQNVETACRTADISDKSYRQWKAASAAPLPMRPVEVTALVPVTSAAMTFAPAEIAGATSVTVSERLTLVAPSGYRAEGLAVESAAALLKALAC